MSVHSLVSRERERFVEDLLGYMTLEEKLGQLNLSHSPHDPGLEAAIAQGRVGGLTGGAAPARLQTLATERSRLGIPLLLATEAMTLPLGGWALAASWDEELACELGSNMAEMAFRAGANCLSGPTVSLDAPGETYVAKQISSFEPHLAARLAAAFAKGASGHGRAGAARALASPAVSGDELSQLRWGLDLIRSEGVLAVDCQALDGELALNLGFGGMLLAECRRIAGILADHFATTSARSPVEAAEKAIGEGLVADYEIDGAVRGVLAVKHALGLFRRPERTGADLPGIREPMDRADIVRRSMVLLRNQSGLLPLSPVSDRVLVVGALEGAGGACAEALGRAGIGHSFAPGLALRRPDESWADPAPGDHFALSLTRDAAHRADFVLVVLDDRHFGPRDASAPWRRPTNAVLAMLRALSPLASRLVAIVATEEPVDLAGADQYFAAVLQCWQVCYGFEEALADVLSGRYSPQGRLPASAGRFGFGQGLGYAESVFSAFTLAAAGDHVAAAIRVRNAGSFASRETVQAYVRGNEGEMRLIAFQHVSLAPGEDVPVRFELGIDELGECYDGQRVDLAPGPREILIGKDVDRLFSGKIEITPALARALKKQGIGMLRRAG